MDKSDNRNTKKEEVDLQETWTEHVENGRNVINNICVMKQLKRLNKTNKTMNTENTNTNELETRGYMHTFKSNSNSSKKTRAAKRFVDERLQDCDNNNLSRPQKRSQARKDYKIKMLDDAPRGIGYSIKELNEHLHYFKTNVEDPIYEELLFQNKLQYNEVPFYKNMSTINTLTGSKLMESDRIPIYILVPRQELLRHIPSPYEDVIALNNLLQKFNNVTLRGSKRTGICKKYANLGAYCCRNKTGIDYTRIHKCCENDYNRLKEMLNRAKFFGKSYLPFGLMSTVQAMKEFIGDKTSIDDMSEPETSVWASAALSYNYVSPAHIDKDAFLSCLMVTYIPDSCKSIYYKYTENMDVALYFCLPEFGVSVAFRPGDVLFFNPLYYHCISQRTEEYLCDEIYVTSLYMKTGQIGGNDNSINLCNFEIEQEINVVLEK